MTVSIDALFGVSHFGSKFGSVSSTDNAFTMQLGGAVDVNVNNSFFIRSIQIDYAPTFFGGNTQHNFQLGFGAGFRFGKGKQKLLSEKKETVPTPAPTPTLTSTIVERETPCHVKVTLESVKYFVAGSFTNPPTPSDDIGSNWKYDIIVKGRTTQITHIPENKLNYGETKPYNDVKDVVFDGIEGTCNGNPLEFKVTVSATEIGTGPAPDSSGSTGPVDLNFGVACPVMNKYSEGPTRVTIKEKSSLPGRTLSGKEAVLDFTFRIGATCGSR